LAISLKTLFLDFNIQKMKTFKYIPPIA